MAGMFVLPTLRSEELDQSFINPVLIAPDEAGQPQTLCKVAAPSSAPGRARKTGSSTWVGFSGSNCAYAASRDAIHG
jgi:hypothetical protein